MIKKKISGIYKIENKNNGKVYIGCSFNILERIRVHKYALKNCIHPNVLLQRAWNKYGEESFDFSVVESFYGSRKDLLEREHYWGDFYNVNNGEFGYNIRTCGSDSKNSFKQDDSVRMKIKLSWNLRVFIKNSIKNGCSDYELREKVLCFIKDNDYPMNYQDDIDKHIERVCANKKNKPSRFYANKSDMGEQFDIDKKIQVRLGAVKIISSIKNKNSRHIFYTLYALSLYFESEQFCFSFELLRKHSRISDYNTIVSALEDLTKENLIKYEIDGRKSVVKWIKRDESGKVVTTIKPNTRLIDHPTLDNLYIL